MLLAGSASGCKWDDDRGVTSSVDKVVQLPAADVSVKAGETVAIGLQALDHEGDGVNGVHMFFGSGSSKLAVESEGGLETIVAAGHGTFAGASGDGIGTTRWAAAADAELGKVSVFAYLLADGTEDDGAAEAARLGVRTFTVEITDAP